MNFREIPVFTYFSKSSFSDRYFFCIFFRILRRKLIRKCCLHFALANILMEIEFFESLILYDKFFIENFKIFVFRPIFFLYFFPDSTLKTEILCHLHFVLANILMEIEFFESSILYDKFFIENFKIFVFWPIFFLYFFSDSTSKTAIKMLFPFRSSYNTRRVRIFWKSNYFDEIRFFVFR